MQTGAVISGDLGSRVGAGSLIAGGLGSGVGTGAGFPGGSGSGVGTGAVVSVGSGFLAAFSVSAEAISTFSGAGLDGVGAGAGGFFSGTTGTLAWEATTIF